MQDMVSGRTRQLDELDLLYKEESFEVDVACAEMVLIANNLSFSYQISNGRSRHGSITWSDKKLSLCEVQ